MNSGFVPKRLCQYFIDSSLVIIAVSCLSIPKNYRTAAPQTSFGSQSDVKPHQHANRFTQDF